MNSTELLIGSHINMSAPNYFLDSAITALNYGENTFMFYTGAPQNSFRVPTNQCKIEEGISILKKNNIDISKIIIHAPYIINLGNPDELKFKNSIEILENELRRVLDFSVKTVVLHPGSSVGFSKEIGLNRVIDGLDLVLERFKNNDLTIALETMSGKGSELCSTFEELKFIINKSKFSNKLGVCLDTCHIHDAGYDLSNFEKILNEFDEIIGLDKLKVIHLNDSKNERGSHKDRHENIGFGHIGFQNLLNVINSKRLSGIPIILETPYFNGVAPYKEEICMLKRGIFDKDLLKKLI